MQASEDMTSAMPFFTEQGHGEGVVCLHSNASTSAQWRALGARLADRFHVIAADSYGAGQSPDWPDGIQASLDAEAALLTPVLERAGHRFHVVGHSYGAAVGMQIAIRHPGRVRSIVAYEPTLFYLLAGDDPSQSPVAGIWHAASEAAAAVARGDSNAASRRFIDFWMSEGTWDAMPANRQAAVAQSMRNVGRWRDAAMTPSVPVEAFASLRTPVLLMSGDRSPESARSVVRLLAATLPQVTVETEPGLGHMGPVTDPDRVNARISLFLDANRGVKS